MRYRLAFREYGTCLGIRCYHEEVSAKGRTFDIRKYADAIIGQWDPHMEVAMGAVMYDDRSDIRSINKVMYATALIPGGKSFFISCTHHFQAAIIIFRLSIPAYQDLLKPTNFLAFLSGYLEIP